MRIVPGSRRFRCYACYYSRHFVFGPFGQKMKPQAGASADEYFVKADGVVYGPVPFRELLEWAKMGRVYGSHEVSDNRGADWQDAASIATLNLVFLVGIGGGAQMCRVHPEAFKQFMNEGSVPPHAVIIDTLTGKTFLASEYASQDPFR